MRYKLITSVNDVKPGTMLKNKTSGTYIIVLEVRNNVMIIGKPYNVEKPVAECFSIKYYFPRSQHIDWMWFADEYLSSNPKNNYINWLIVS